MNSSNTKKEYDIHIRHNETQISRKKCIVKHHGKHDYYDKKKRNKNREKDAVMSEIYKIGMRCIGCQIGHAKEWKPSK